MPGIRDTRLTLLTVISDNRSCGHGFQTVAADEFIHRAKNGSTVHVAHVGLQGVVYKLAHIRNSPAVPNNISDG
jgi:hypothetical protein